MTYSKNIYQYKHDITGKFKDVSAVVNQIDQSTFDKAEGLELFHMVHESVIKMVKTSKEVIRCSFEIPMALHIVESELAPSIKKVHVDSLVLGFKFIDGTFTYYYNKNENDEDLRIACGKLLALLPFNVVKIDLKDQDEQEKLESVCHRNLRLFK